MNRRERDRLLAEHEPEAIAARLERARDSSLLGDAVLGAIDGCVTTFAIVCGAAGAGVDARVAFVLGASNLLADGFSMAASNFEAVSARREARAALERMEREHIERIPAGEREEIRQAFRRKGFEGELLERVVETLTSDRELWVQTMLNEEHGVPSVEAQPLRAGVATFTAFVAVGALPLLPLLGAYGGMEAAWEARFAASAAAAGAAFFAVGVLKALVLGTAKLRAGLRALFTGGLACAIAWAVGALLR